MSSFARSHLSLISDPYAGEYQPQYVPAAYDSAPAYDVFAADSYAPGAELPAPSWTDADAGEEPWRLDALCAETDPEAFFPEKGGSTREAKRICGRCEVKVECLEYALGHDERFGIWGGLSERERRKLKRRAA